MPTSAQDTAQVRAQVEIAGSDLSGDSDRKLKRVIVDTHLHVPDMFEITFEDDSAAILDDAKVSIGAEVKIWAGSSDAQDAPALIVGEVTSIEGDYHENQFRTVVRGYDKSHRFHRGRRTEVFNNSKDSDIARQIANRVGVDIGDISTSRITHTHIAQVNQTDWEFLNARAREIGYEVRVTDDKFYFVEPPEVGGGFGMGGGAVELTYRDNLHWLRPRLNSAEQVEKVEVRAWDMKTKKALVGTATVDAPQYDLFYAPGDLRDAFGGGMLGSISSLAGGGDNSVKSMIFDRPFATQAECDALAKALAFDIGNAMVSLEGMCRGNPGVQAGATIELKDVVVDFEGKYVVTNAKHVVDSEGYRTNFIVSGRSDHSVLSMTGGVGGNSKPIYGLAVGIVDDNNDPDKLGRVKLQFPWLSDDYVSDWARVAQLGAGPDSGNLFLPEVNDEVLVAFEFGDVRRPYVVGGLFNGKDKPMLGTGLFDMGKVTRRGVVSRKGHMLLFFDDDQKSGLSLLSANKKFGISFNETTKEIHVKATDNQAKITIKTTSSADIILQSQANVSVEAQQNLTLKGQAGVKIESSGVVEVKGSMIKLN